MLERNFSPELCCWNGKELKLDPEDAYNKNGVDSEKKLNVLHATYVIGEKTVELEPETKEDSKDVKLNKTREKTVGISKPKTGWRRYCGIFLMLFATMTYSIGTLFIKILQDTGCHALTISYLRFQGLLFPTATLLLYLKFVQKAPIFDSICPLTDVSKFKTGLILVIRSLVGCTSTICHIYALQYINLADASVIAFSCPVFVILIAHLLGMEKMGYVSFLVTVFTLAGVAVICRPPMLTGSSKFDTNMLIGSGLAFASMMCTSTVILILRYLRGIHFALLTVSYAFFGTLECAVFGIFSGELSLSLELRHWILCIGLIFFTFLAQISLIASLKYEEAGPVALLQTTDSIFSFIWQYLAFAVIPDVYSLSGAAIVIFGVGVISLKKVVSHLPETHKARRYLGFILK